MLPNAFIGKPEQPTEDELAAVLGPSKALWDGLVAGLAADHEVTVREWNCYSLKAGWSLRLKRGKRAIVYLSPCRGSFRAAFALGDQAVEAARHSKLPARVLEEIGRSRKYAEGTAVRIDVKSARDMTAVKKLAAIKIQN